MTTRISTPSILVFALGIANCSKDQSSDQASDTESSDSESSDSAPTTTSDTTTAGTTTAGTTTADSAESDEANSSDTDSGSSESTTDEATSSETETGDTGLVEPWQVVHQAGEDQGALMSVWGTSPSEVFAVGGQIQPNTGTVLRFDGALWIPEELPEGTPMLDWVYGVGERVWAVGRAGAILVREAGVWSSEASPTNKILWGLWGASKDELWAVGGNGTSDVPVLLRRDGASQAWSEVDYPELGVVSHGLFKIWGTGASEVWAVGDRGATLRFDGASWTAHPSEAAIDLISLWGTPSEGIVAAGGRASGHLARVEGEAWIGQGLDTPGLNGIWIDPAGPITVVGNAGTILSVDPGGFEWVEEPSPTPMVLHAVFGFSGGPRFAVGGSLLAPPPYIGVIVESP